MRLWMTEQMTEQNCLKAAAQVNFQLVFMDIYMENMDGMGMPNKKKQSNLSIQLLFCFRCRLMLFYYSVHRNA